MDATSRRISPLIWVGLGFTLALLLLALLLAVLRMQSGTRTGSHMPVLGKIADFSLTNQNGTVTTADDLTNKVWIADIIFTRCAGPCLRMSRKFEALQKDLPAGAMLVSLTTDPEFDTPEVLKTYGARFNADFGRWIFLTGTKEQISAMATGSLKLTGIAKAPEQQADPADLFIHSTIFVLVDKHLRLRAVYETEGDGIDSDRVRAKALSDLKMLLRES